MKILFSLLLVMCNINFCIAQSSYSVHYTINPFKKPESLPITINGVTRYRTNTNKTRLVFNDSLAFFYYFGLEKDPLRKSNIFSSKAIHHSIYYLKKLDVLYNVKAWPSNSPTELLVFPREIYNWKLTNKEMILLGYRCQEAYTVKNSGDTIFASYAIDLPYPYGPYAYTGLPGLALEYFDQQFNVFIVADNILKGDYIIQLPRKYIITDKKN